jgi:hypothetical protein
MSTSGVENAMLLAHKRQFGTVHKNWSLVVS